jgi:REP element-mobilizing transposase RayT
MTAATPRPQRRSIRLSAFDYTQAGAYYVTICSHSDVPLFGAVREETVALNALGELIRSCWLAIPDHFPHAALDHFVIMPNHLHGIIVLTTESEPAPHKKAPAAFSKPISGSLPTIIASFKAAVSRGLRKQSPERITIWHRNYYEHVIRSEADYSRIFEYINNNPLQWAIDADRSHVRYGEKLPYSGKGPCVGKAPLAGMTCHAPTKPVSL